MVKEAQLEAVPLFTRLPASGRRRVAKAARSLVLDAGTEIVREGGYALEFYAIVEGRMEVRQGGEQIAELGPGDFFGEIGVLPHGGLKWGRRSASVVAASEVTIVAIPGHDARQLVEEVPEMGEALLAAARRRSSAGSTRRFS